MTFWVAGAVVVSSAIGASSAKKAASTQAAAATQSADTQRQIFERQAQLQEPWRQAGITALNKLVPLSTEYTPFGQQQFQADPGYAFRMSEGLKGLERSAAARGGLLSGSTLKGIERYGQDLASQEYQNAFNRYQAERQARLGPLQSLSGVGQSTAQQVAGQMGQMGANVGEAMQNAAAARASGYMGGANALTRALNTGLNYYQNQNFINRMPLQQYAGFNYSPAGGGYGYTYQNPALVGPV